MLRAHTAAGRWLLLFFVAHTAHALDSRAEAFALAQHGHYVEAERMLKGLVARSPEDPELQFALGQLYYRFGYYDAAIAPLAKASMLTPHAQAPQVLEAVCLFKTGADEQALKLTSKLLSQTPPAQDIDLTLTYAQYLYEHGELDKALAQADSAVQFSPEHPLGYFWLARILLQKGQIDAARRAAEQSVDLAPQLPYARNLLVRIYTLLGRKADADVQTQWLRQFEARKAAP